MPHGNYEIPGPPLNKELCSSKAITRSKKAIVPVKLFKGTSAERRFEFRLSVGSWMTGRGPGRACGQECPYSHRSFQSPAMGHVHGGWQGHLVGWKALQQ